MWQIRLLRTVGAASIEPFFGLSSWLVPTAKLQREQASWPRTILRTLATYETSERERELLLPRLATQGFAGKRRVCDQRSAIHRAI